MEGDGGQEGGEEVGCFFRDIEGKNMCIFSLPFWGESLVYS